jgi:hypothetical protein
VVPGPGILTMVKMIACRSMGRWKRCSRMRIHHRQILWTRTKLEMALKERGDKDEISKPPSVEELAGIPEASSIQSVARRSKHRVG